MVVDRRGTCVSEEEDVRGRVDGRERRERGRKGDVACLRMTVWWAAVGDCYGRFRMQPQPRPNPAAVAAMVRVAVTAVTTVGKPPLGPATDES